MKNIIHQIKCAVNGKVYFVNKAKPIFSINQSMVEFINKQGFLLNLNEYISNEEFNKFKKLQL